MNIKTAKRAVVDALVFDAYGTLFDVQSVSGIAERLFPSHGAALSQLWRTKQLEYTWLQSLMQSPTQRRDDFAAVTAPHSNTPPPRWAAARCSRTPPTARCVSRTHCVSRCRTGTGAPRALPLSILSNGTREMLEPLVAGSGMARYIDTVISVDAAGIYKPSPRVYQLAVDHLKLLPVRIGFVSSNGWDAIGAKAFGFTVFWVRRNDAPLDRHGPRPDYIISSLAELPALVEG